MGLVADAPMVGFGMKGMEGEGGGGIDEEVRGVPCVDVEEVGG